MLSLCMQCSSEEAHTERQKTMKNYCCIYVASAFECGFGVWLQLSALCSSGKWAVFSVAAARSIGINERNTRFEWCFFSQLHEPNHVPIHKNLDGLSLGEVCVPCVCISCWFFFVEIRVQVDTIQSSEILVNCVQTISVVAEIESQIFFSVEIVNIYHWPSHQALSIHFKNHKRNLTFLPLCVSFAAMESFRGVCRRRRHCRHKQLFLLSRA